MQINKSIVRDLIILGLIYLASQWLLLIVSGYWWDDAVLVIRNRDELALLYKSAGNTFYGLSADVMDYSRFSYKYITFVLGFINSLFVYGAMVESQLFERKECFWIGALFATVPINDARMTWICFPYTVCVCMFFASVYAVTLWRNGKKYVWGWRILSWILLMYSYVVNSLLVFSALILFYLWYKDYQDLGVKSNRRYLNVFLRNIDYVLLPCTYWIIKILYFKPFGPYVEYNAFGWSTLIKAFVNLPRAVGNTICNILYNYITILQSVSSKYWIMACFVSCIWWYAKHNKKMIWGEPSNDRIVTLTKKIETRIAKLFLVSLAILALGIFPYMVVGRMSGVVSVGVDGRDSALLGLGMALIIYYGVRLVWYRESHSIIYCVIIILGILHFNNWYLNYQQEWYQELEFKEALRKHREIIDNNSFLVQYRYPVPCGSDRLHNMNVNAYESLGSQSRFFTVDLNYFADKKVDTFRRFYGMDDYDSTDMKIDGIIYFNNRRISRMNLLKLKYKEIFLPNEFKKDIANRNRIAYRGLTREESDMIIKIYKWWDRKPESVSRISG